METTVNHSDDWAIFAYGLLVCVATILVAYIVLRVWPRSHYPRFFSVVAAVTAVAAMYVYQVPGAGFGLGALAILMCFALLVPESLDALFENGGTAKPARSDATPGLRMSGLNSTISSLALGVLVGLIVSLLAVAALLVPPAHLKRWVVHPDPLGERIERALNPGEEWVATRDRERKAAEKLTRTEAELGSVTKRLTEAEGSLAKVQDELVRAVANTVRSIQIKENSGSRHANGAVYIGVTKVIAKFDVGCWTIVSSDKVDSATKKLRPGEAFKIASSRGTHRIVLTGLAADICTFDLVQD